MADVRVFQAGVLASAVGTGLVYPVTAIYLNSVRGFSYPLVGAAIALMSLGAALSSSVAGRVLDRVGSRTLARIALSLQACGALGIALAPDADTVIAAMVVQATGAGAYYTSLPLLLVDVGGEQAHLRLSARRYALNNAGIGVGAALSGVILSRLGTTGFLLLYLANAVSFAVFALLLRTGQGRRRTAGPVSPPTVGYRALLRQPALLRLLAVQCLVVGAGFAQLDSSLPILLRVHSGASLIFIGALIATNTAVVVLAQRLGTGAVERRGAHAALVTMSVIWLLAMLLGLLSTFTDGLAGPVLLVGFMVLFSLGESLYAPAFQAAVVNGVELSAVARFSALASMTWTLAAVGAPALGVLLVALPWPSAYWLALAGCCTAMCLLTTSSAKAAVPVR